MNTTAINDLSERPQAHWVSRSAFQFIVIFLVLNQLAIGWAVYHAHWWLAAALVLTGSHFMHGALIGFHEASHGLLRQKRWFNEFDGVLIGTLTLVSFSLYRVLHQWHHVHLATIKDEEFWPHTDPNSPRWFRVCMAGAELTFGLIVGPAIFFRTFARRGSPVRNKRVRRRIWMEYGLIVLFWGSLITTVAAFGAWKYFLWMYVGPAFIAANLQSWRKYIEHVGMTGSTVNGCTRSIVAKGPMGRLFALTLLHEPFHGVHHRHAGWAHSELPHRLELLEPKEPGERPPFRSYRHALGDLLRCLADPRVGPQWERAEEKPQEEEEEGLPSSA